MLQIFLSALMSSAMSISVPITSTHAGMISDESGAVKDLLQRLIPDYHCLFDLQILSNCNEDYPACFEVHVEGERITVKGSSGAPISAVPQL